jgi:methionyl-tRNA formyltransferase
MPAETTAPIRVVMFGSGPYITRDAQEFLVRLNEANDIELLGAFCQSAAQSNRAVFQDLKKRRGILAYPLMAVYLWERSRRRFTQRGREKDFQKKFRGIENKISFVPDIHAAEVLDVVRSLAPDLGLVYGSPILKPALFEIPGMGTLGIHHGKVPEYRGNKTTFWAMFNGEAAAGVTIQKINAGLDTGEIVNEGQVEIGRRSHTEVWQALEALGLDLYLKSIREVHQGTVSFRPQSGRKGPLYRNPKPIDYLRYWLKRLAGQVRRAPRS